MNRRLAVVIGNSEYQNLADLASATTDADAIQKMLQSLEFEVTYGINLSRDGILKCFSDILNSREYKTEEIVFYYSGRAIPSDDKVYLAPYDAAINLPDTLSKSYLDVDSIITTLLKKRRNYRVPIIVILNCYHFLLKPGSVGDNYQGLPLRRVSQEIGKNYNIAILYSMTKDDPDGNAGKGLSPFTQILLENMEKDCTINRIHSIILRFIEDSDKLSDKQVSWLYQSLFESYRFYHPKSIAIVPIVPIVPHDPYYGIPLSNRNFVDRPGIFAKIDAIFANNSIGGRAILALQGLGGTGKTQIMLQYCYIHRLEYNFVFWLEMDGKTTALESFRKLAINLGLDVESANKKSADYPIIKWVSSWLEKKTKWLLLLNNVDEEMAKDIFNVLPQYGGNIIMTTREPISLTKAKIVHVSKMEEDEALTLLYGTTPIHLINQQSRQHQYAKQYAKQIISELDYLPLAVDLARAYTNTMLISFEEYLKVFRNQHDRVEVFSHHDEDNTHQYNHSLATVWKISFDRIKTESPVAALILNACSFFEPELIPISFFERQYPILENIPGASFSSGDLSSDNLWIIIRKAIASLVKFAFVTRTSNEVKDGENPINDTLTIHRLVQKVICDTMSKNEKAHWVSTLSKAVKSEVGFSDSYSSHTRTMMNAYFLHICHFSKVIDITQRELISEDLFELVIKTVIHQLDNGVYFGIEELAYLTLSISESINGPENELMATSLNCLAKLYHRQGNYAKAEPLYEQELMIRKKMMGALGLEKPEMATCLNDLAFLYFNQGDYAKAKPLLKQALAIREKVHVLEPEHPDIARSLNDLALLNENLGNYTKAMSLYKRALMIREKVLGTEHPETAASLDNLARLYKNQGNYKEAEPLHRRALEIRKKVLGPEHPSMVSSLNNLALLYKDQGNYSKAKSLYEESLVLSKKVLGPEHPETAVCLNSLASLYKDQGKYSESEQLYKQALVIREKALGPEHPDTASSLDNLATLYESQGNHGEAKKLYKRALDIRKKTLKPENPDIASSLNNLAFFYFKQGKYAKAKPLYQQALTIREKTLGPNHPDTAESLNGLALLYERQRNYDKAEPLYERALVVREKVLGQEHPNIARSLNDLALLYFNQENYTKAELLYKRALMIREKKLGPEHRDTASSLNSLAFLYFSRENYIEAEPLYERALTIRVKTLEPEHEEVAESLNNLALLYFNQENYNDAEPLYEEALRIREKKLGLEHSDTASSLNNLASLYEKQGNDTKAKKLYKRALAIRERVLEVGHPDIISTLNSLASIYFRQRKLYKAKPLYKRVLATREKVLGFKHLDITSSLDNLALLYRDQRNYEKAEPFYERSLVIREKELGPEHPDTASSLNNLASLYKEKGDYTKAEPLYERSLVIREKTLGPEHPDTASTLNNLASLYKVKGDYTKAEPLYERSLAIREKALGLKHPDTADSLNDLVSLYEDKEDYAKAKSLNERLLIIPGVEFEKQSVPGAEFEKQSVPGAEFEKQSVWFTWKQRVKKKKWPKEKKSWSMRLKILSHKFLHRLRP